MMNVEVNVLLKIRLALIKVLAGNEPILLNWCINSELIKGMHRSAVYIPPRNAKIDSVELMDKAVLTPTRNHAQKLGGSGDERRFC